MEDGTDVSLSIAQIVQRLRGSHLHSQLERQAKDCLHRPEIKLESLKEDVRSFLRASGWEKRLQNAVYRELHVQLPQCHPTAPAEHLKEPLAYMRKAQASWEKRVLKSLNSMSTELGVPLARMRPAGEQKDLTNKWNEMGTDEPDLSRFRPVYAPKDFLEVLISLRNPNHDSSEDMTVKSHWGLIQVPLNIRDIPQLRQAYSELNLNNGQLGIDDHAHVHPDLFENNYVHIGKKVVVEQDSAAAQQYSRRGCPTGLRSDLWALILNSTNQPQDVMHYEQLKAGVIQHDLLVDYLIYKDVKLTASNDDYYFVFEDFLYQVLLCFSRDTAVLEHFKYNSATPPKSYVHGKVGNEEFAVLYPPNGVIPFHGFSMYGEYPTIVQLSRRFQIRVELMFVPQWHLYASCTTSHPNCTASSGRCTSATSSDCTPSPPLPPESWLCVCSSSGCCRLTCRNSSTTFDRSRHSRCGSPLSGWYGPSLATSQPISCFCSGIESWDTIRWKVVAVLAAAVFAFRAENLMEVTSLASAEAVLADLSTLKVMPLIQIFLFATAI
ncbi:TBC1 domain family member 19 [Oryzias melastigma]|uniref:TBC1 domain family member 19 n=1 Tax=Oryzias melastigma TaxID=30732 RepID=A0A834F7Y3_ORYME|nr:TBC1 domain family member 19 [Oryzias melastigma]